MDDKEREQLIDRLDWHWFAQNILKQTKHNGYYIKALCPYHDDHEASLSVIKTHGGFRCHSCGHTGDIIDLTMDALGIDFKEAIDLLGAEPAEQKKVYNKNPYVRPMEPVMSWTDQNILDKHQALLSNDEEMNIVNKYGISKDIVIKTKLGIHHDSDCLRLVIPIVVEGKLIAVKLHRVTGKPQCKALSAPGSKTALYPHGNIVKSNKLLFVEGEPDVLCAFSVGLHKDTGLTPCTVTTGALTFRVEWIPLFAGKTIYICYDNDKAGSQGIDKVLSALDGRATIYLVRLPDKCKDIRDYFSVLGKTTADFMCLLQDNRYTKLYDKSHPLYIRKRLYPILEECCGDRFRWEGLKQEIDGLFKL